MLRRLAKISGWLLGSTFALALIAYAILFVANLEDQPPVAEIAALKALQNPTSPIVSDDNSYLYMMGFSGPPDADPMALGLDRYEWMGNARPEFRIDDDPLSEDYAYRNRRSDTVAQLAKACSKSAAECLRFLQPGSETVEQWLADERWLLDRYRGLLNLPEYREAIPFELLAPSPSYSVIFEAQRLHIVDIWRSAAASDAAAVKAALDSDLGYWRMVLENSDALITKMIATAAIIQHFKIGNLALRPLPHEVAADGIPDSWRLQISDNERSMRRSLAGEWTYFDESTRRIVANNDNPLGDWTGITDSTTLDRAAWVVLRPFWQHQDLTNRHARLMLDLGNVFDVPYDEVPIAVGLANDLQESAYEPFSRLYNFTGDLIMGVDHWSVSDYAVRVSDLEGIRRAALLMAELRSEGVTKSDIGQRLLASEIVDPYRNAPFDWHDDSDAIIFHGLEPHARSEHELVY